MKLHHDVHAIADRLPNLLERLDRSFHLRGGDIEAAVFLSCRIEWPDFHGIDSAFEQALRQRVRAIHERVEILERSFALAQIPVGDRADVLRADIPIARTGIVYAK